MEEPKKMFSLVRDSDGDLWMKGRTRWTCKAHGEISRVGRLVWVDLVNMYGPIEFVRGGRNWE